jgi:hypothetical protein
MKAAYSLQSYKVIPRKAFIVIIYFARAYRYCNQQNIVMQAIFRVCRPAIQRVALQSPAAP